MATRTSSRIKTKPVISYDILEDDEDSSASEKRVKKGRGRGRPKKTADDDDFIGSPVKKKGRGRPRKNGNDENKDKGNIKGRKKKPRKRSPSTSNSEDENSDDVVSDENDDEDLSGDEDGDGRGSRSGSEESEDEDDKGYSPESMKKGNTKKAPAPGKRGRGRPPKPKDDESEEDDDDQKDQKAPAPGKRGRGRPRKIKDVYSDVDDDVDDKTDNNKAAAATKKNQPLGKRKRSDSAEDKDETEIADKKGKIEQKIEEKMSSGNFVVPVDMHCPQGGSKSVYCDGDGPWDAMCNQTNVGQNNNKYYLLQLLSSGSGGYSTWYRWGRIGYTTASQTKLTHFGSLEAAQKDFMKKFTDKTRNHWPCTMETFTKYKGKYDLIRLDYTTKEEGGEDKTVVKDEIKKEPVVSKLDPRVVGLMELISNVRTMEQAVMEMNYDVKKSPLGKLSAEQIKSGYEALTTIEECIKEGQPHGSKAKDACSAFYTRIPHSFGFHQPPLITTLEQVKLKIDLLDMLIDIEAAVKAIKREVPDVHPADSFYKNLKLEMTALEKDSDTFQMLESYLHNTHGTTHSAYKLQVEDIFEINKEGEDERFKGDLGNKQLLWHGSRLTNWGGIFSQGLRIAPPEAPVTGYMFGKGVYFADMASKSANYCFTTRQNPTGILLLCEVALGAERELLHSDYNANKLPSDKHSTKGMGANIPNPAQSKMLGDVKVPMGVQAKSNISSSLLYNEYIVYNVAQIKMKYALRVKFNYR